MSNFYRYIFPFLDALFRRSHDINVIFGIVLGIFLGFFPLGTLQWFIAFIAFICVRVNLLAFLTLFCSSLIMAQMGDPIWNSVGFRLLTNRSDLYPLWGWMHHAPILPFTEFNNTVVLGVSVTALLIAPMVALIHFFFRKGIRQTLSKLWYHTKMSRFYAHYRRT